jgi:hypothetical protein
MVFGEEEHGGASAFLSGRNDPNCLKANPMVSLQARYSASLFDMNVN